MLEVTSMWWHWWTISILLEKSSHQLSPMRRLKTSSGSGTILRLMIRDPQNSKTTSNINWSKAGSKPPKVQELMFQEFKVSRGNNKFFYYTCSFISTANVWIVNVYSLSITFQVFILLLFFLLGVHWLLI